MKLAVSHSLPWQEKLDNNNFICHDREKPWREEERGV